jgi:hypothetical protein
MPDLDTLRYPVGPMPRRREPLDRATRERYIDVIAAAPAQFRALVSGRSDDQLDRSYRPGGWTVRQVVHHVPDSHMNAYIRMKLAATEDSPVIKAYEEALWAELPEAKSGPVELSLALLDGLHGRWAAFLRGLPESAFARPFAHPAWGLVTIDEALVMYEWHCRHHAAHIAQGLAAGR